MGRRETPGATAQEVTDMFSSRRFSRRSAAVLSLVAVAGLGACATPAEGDTAAPAGECSTPRDDARALPDGLRDGSRLFLNTYRSVLVQLDSCGRVSLIEPTGWDSCYLLDGDEVLGYPC
jgi:ferric-dicitrate binding protein FerR (iron transport regulator)